MKQLLFAVTVFAAAVSFADSSSVKENYTRIFEVTSAKYAKNHIVNPGQGNITLDYANQSVTLTVQKLSGCRTLICPKIVMMPLVITAPITSIITDNCGIHTVTAQLDERPVDGGLTQIVVLDPSEITCQTFVAVLPKAKYVTKHYNRMESKEVVTTSKMVLKDISASLNLN